MGELFIPTLHTFAMNNIFTGSMGLFRFRAKPEVVMATAKEVTSRKAQFMWNTGMGFTAIKKVRWRAKIPSP